MSEHFLKSRLHLYSISAVDYFKSLQNDDIFTPKKTAKSSPASGFTWVFQFRNQDDPISFKMEIYCWKYCNRVKFLKLRVQRKYIFKFFTDFFFCILSECSSMQSVFKQNTLFIHPLWMAELSVYLSCSLLYYR